MHIVVKWMGNSGGYLKGRKTESVDPAHFKESQTVRWKNLSLSSHAAKKKSNCFHANNNINIMLRYYDMQTCTITQSTSEGNGNLKK